MNEIRFILNNETVTTGENPAIVLLDYLRAKERLTGAKEGCKEGDCGACTVLLGDLKDGMVKYRSVNSCLYPIGNLDGRHVVTIEGLNLEGNKLNTVQQAFIEEGASQCGFCTPGFIVSLTGYLINSENPNAEDAVDSMDGNICRCTGHNSIIRAAGIVADKFTNEVNTNGIHLKYLSENGVIPEYFTGIADRLKELQYDNKSNINESSNTGYIVCGGTDIFVQRPAQMLKTEVRFINREKTLSYIKEQNGYCHIGCTSTVSDILESHIFQKYFPSLKRQLDLFGSTPIRNSSSIGGNINNASPIGDMTAFFMALNSTVVLSDGGGKREVPLRKYYKAYKTTDRKENEFMESIKFKLPEGEYYFNFEKVSKRTCLDIASVNSAALIRIEDGIITEAHLSAGGVGATPLYLEKASEFLITKEVNGGTVAAMLAIAESEISPISDARGSADYKRLLCRRLLSAHFITLFADIINLEDTL